MRAHGKDSSNKNVSFNEKVGSRFIHKKIRFFLQISDDDESSPTFLRSR